MIEVDVERPVAGGRMLARLDGRVVFVAGAIPGERVQARVERAGPRGAFATTVEVLAASPDRRQPPCDPRCGGLAFAHIAYPRQRTLKGEILVDAFRRLGHLSIAPPEVAPSPETGYRVRARLHVKHRRPGFYLEGSHALCDAASTGQLSDAAVEAVVVLVEAAGELADEISSVTVSENMAGTERVLHVDPVGGAGSPALVGRLGLNTRTTGVSIAAGTRLRTVAGRPTVTDTARDLFGDAPSGDGPLRWTRHATSFFQGNRFLTGALVARVLDVAQGERVADLYAGVGLFAAGLAARGGRVLAVEGDGSSWRDLVTNSEPWSSRLRAVHAPVEQVLADPPAPAPDVIVIDPPRTGLSASATEGLARWSAPRIVYVSCDPPTLARDVARLAQSGYGLTSLEAFDLFPTTPHVEAVAVLDR